ncbi:MAG: ATP-binding protein [Acidobacteriota bacterium]
MARRLAAAGIPQRYSACTLEKFNVNRGEAKASLLKARSLCQQYCDAFFTVDGVMRESGLLFVGPPGAGKTHLSVAVLRHLIQRYRLRGRFVDFTSLIHQIQSSFDPGSPDSKRQILDPVIGAELLVLDELGAQKPTPWVMDTLYLIINTRYTERRPTLFTTNYRLQEVAAAEPRKNPGGEFGYRSAGASDRPSGREPAVASLSARLTPMLVSRLFEMAQPVEMLAVEDFRREVKLHQHRLAP